MHQTHLTIKLYSHHFSVTGLSPRGRELCMEFAKKWAQWSWVTQRGHSHRIITKIYGAARRDRNEFRFHINQLPQFNEHLEMANMQEILVAREPQLLPLAQAAKMSMNTEDFTPLDYQIPIISYLDAPLPAAKLVTLQTGKGKGFVTMQSCANQGERVAVIVKPMYMEKWWEEIQEIYTDVDANDILMVRGSKHLMALQQLAKEGRLDCKWIIISNKTMQNWIKDYEQAGEHTLDLGYSCLPQDFFGLLGVGTRVIDEVHQDWHLNFKIDLYTHVKKSISLSATMLTDDPFLMKTYQLVHPSKDRAPEIPLDKYIHAFPTYYRFEKPEKIQTNERGQTSYSHNAFEESIMAQPKVLENYLELIRYVYATGFMVHPRPQKSCLIFCYTQRMCQLVVDHLKKHYPGKDIRRYVSGDSYEEDLIAGETVVSTLGSAGTAIDKPHLTNVVLTNAVDSVKSNVQSFGRLRNLAAKNVSVIPGDQDTYFHFFVCTDVPKHVDYDMKKQKVLQERAKTCQPLWTGRVL